jgi:hypothetical protein
VEPEQRASLIVKFAGGTYEDGYDVDVPRRIGSNRGGGHTGGVAGMAIARWNLAGYKLGELLVLWVSFGRISQYQMSLSQTLQLLDTQHNRFKQFRNGVS